MTEALYGYPMLPKAGLGNMLIPWADCLLWCHDTGARMVSPRWTKVRLGPYLRREREKRQYQRLFTTAGHISGLQRLWLLAMAQRVAAEDWRAGRVVSPGRRPTLACFSDMNGFKRLVGRHREVAAELNRITRPEYRPGGLTSPFVGLHIRLGDYPPRTESANQIYYRLPLDWYVAGLRQLRQTLGHDLEALVFSDGTDAELAPVLSLPNVKRSPFSTAITDMLALAKAAAIITSRSTFSLWGAYLGQLPSLWYPRKRDICGDGVLTDGHGTDLEVEWMAGQALPDEFVAEVKRRCQAAS